MSQDKADFSPVRAYLWPIHAFELRKFLPLFLLAFFISFNYNILRNMKDALLVTAEASGAEVIPFIKVWGILPGAFLMTFIYSRLNNRLQRDRVFYTMIGIFLTFFALFTFLIYPICDCLHLHKTADFLQARLPSGCKGLIAMVRYWSFSSFYIMSELWSSTVLSMLFWGFANEVTRLGEAKRFYGLISVGLNLATISSGQVSVFLTSKLVNNLISFAQNEWHQSIVLLTCTVIISGMVIIGIYRYMTQKLTDDDYAETPKKSRFRMSMRENFAYLARSKYLLLIAIIVLAYNIVINLVEVIWKDQVRQLHPQPISFNAYMGQITTITGIFAFLTSFLLSGQIIRKFGWTATALITPIIFFVTSAGFFFFFFGSDHLIGVLAMLGTSPLALVVFFGSAQNCFSRAAKYTLFDATKEMAFIPLSLESKMKGKAAIDGVGSRLGKSGGSLIHQMLLIAYSTISASAHVVSAILFGFIVVWIVAILSLGKKFNALAKVKTPPPSTPAIESAELAKEEKVVVSV